jgi:LacI family transcriptional regulator
MRDIGRALGVSIATVSRALADSPRVKPETLQRVKAKAAELGYQQDPALGSLNAYREGRRKVSGFHGIIAWLTTHPSPDAWRSDWTSLKYFNALEHLAAKLGYKVEPFWVHPTHMPPARLDSILRARGVRGILLPALPENVPSIDFAWDRYAVVALSNSVLSPRVHCVQKNFLFDIRTVVAKLAELGYRKPLLAVHTRFHKGMHGIHEGAFAVATRDYMGEARPVIYDQKILLGTAIGEFIAEEEVDSIVSTFSLSDLNLGAMKLPPWVALDRYAGVGEQAGIYHDLDQVPRCALDHLISMLHRGEYGLPEHPIVMLLQGAWNPGNLMQKSVI